MSRLTLLTGGVRCGKSSHAVELALQYPAPRAFIATAEPIDDEMRARIANHQAERGQDFVDVEAPVDVAAALRSVQAGTQVAVVDCLTVWVTNLMHHKGHEVMGLPEISAFLELIEAPPCDLIVVTNEVGWGIVPANAMARTFRDCAGWLNQQVAQRASRVLLMVSGLPLELKNEASK